MNHFRPLKSRHLNKMEYYIGVRYRKCGYKEKTRPKLVLPSSGSFPEHRPVRFRCQVLCPLPALMEVRSSRGGRTVNNVWESTEQFQKKPKRTKEGELSLSKGKSGRVYRETVQAQSWRMSKSILSICVIDILFEFLLFPVTIEGTADTEENKIDKIPSLTELTL